MGKWAKQPTPEASLSPKSDTMTEHRNSVLTTANQNVWTEMLKKNESFAKVAPATFPQSAVNSRLPSRVASPVEFRPKIQDSYNNNNVGVGLPTQAQLFPQRRRSSLPGSGGAYELVSGFGKRVNDGSQLQQPGRRTSLRKESLRGQRSFLDSSSMSQKLQWMDLQMRVPEYLENLRGLSRQAHSRDAALHAEEQSFSHLPQLGQKRRSTLVLNEDGGEGTGQLPWFNRSSMANRGSFTRPSIREGSVSSSSFTRPLVSKTATEERKGQGRAVEDRRARQGSVVEVPVDPKHWLLQSLRLQDHELQELFDQMEDVPELNAFDISGVRDEWNELDKRTSEFPPEVGMLVKDQTLLDKVKHLLTRYIEVQDAVKSKERQEWSTETDEEQVADEEMRAKSPAIFEGFERNPEGNLLPVFSEGTSLCSLCGQMRTEKLMHDSVSSPSPLLEPPPPTHALPSFIPLEDYVIYQSIVQPVGHEKEYKSVYSPQEKMFYTVLFPALQPGKREDVILLGEWLQHAVHNKKCHDSDGHVADIDVSFLLHSIAFLEVVRQVSLEYEERGDMLLHLWRQMLRVFNQVMASTEPKMASVSAELVRLREVIDLSKEQFSDLTRELASVTLKFKTVSDKLKQQNTQITRLQRCRLCLAENLTPRAREKFVRRATMKRFANNAEALQLQEDAKAAEELLQESLASKTAPAPSGAPSVQVVAGERVEGGGKGASSKSRGEGGTGEVVGESAAASTGGIVSDSGMAVAAPAPEAAHAKGQEPAAKGEEEPGTVTASPGDIIPGSPAFRIFKRISQGLTHDDGLHADMPAQTDDPAKKHPFREVLERPKTAPPRLNTYGMETFEPLSAEEAVAFKKLKREKRLKHDEEARKRGKLVENVAEGGEQETEESIRELAAETMLLLEQVGLHPKMVNRFRGILAKLRMLKEGALSVEGGWLEGLDPETEAKLSELMASMGLEAEADKKKKGKKDQWGKLRPGDSKRGSKIADIADELMGRRGSGRGSEIKPIKAKDLPFVPLGFAKMMKISPPPKVIKNFNERQLLKLVEGIYASKIVADAVDDDVDNERQTACEFVYDYMLNIYGLKGLAESAVHGVFKKIKKMMISKGIDKCHKVRLFQRFCGFDPARGYAEPDLYMYLKVLARGQSKVGVLYSEQDDGIVFLNCAQADYLFDEPTLVEHFNEDRDAVAGFINKFAGLHATTEKVTPELQKILKTTQVKRLDFDLLMENVIDFNPSKEDTRIKVKTATKVQPLTVEEEKALENLFVAGDANQDGVLTFTEFREIISSAESSITQQNALRMFRETLVLMPDGGDSISPQAFATVAHTHGIKAPTDIIFHLLKKTWDQIQDDVNPDKLAQEEQRQEAFDLREKLEELISSSSNVSEAVLAFRTFVLKFCGGQEGDAEKPADAGHDSDESE